MNQKKIKSDPTKTILVITVGFLVIYFFSGFKWSLYTAIIVGVLGLLSDLLAKKIDYLWMKLTWVLSMIVPNVLLSVIFYLFLTPIALLSRIFGEKNQLSLKNTKDSLFKENTKKFEKSSFEKTW
jgi:hypothetical protein